MKSLITAALAVASLTVSACDTASQGDDGASNVADAQGAQQAPMSFIDGLPVIPLDPAGFRGAVQGPMLALVYFQRRQPITSQEIRVVYRGNLGCSYTGLTLGVVQDGVKVGDYLIRGQAIDRSGTPGNCMALVPLGALHEGTLEFYAFNQSGTYDSAFGGNYRFALNYDNVIP